MLEGEDKLIRKAQGGDGECYSQLYNHYLSKIYRFVLFKVGHRQTAEDLVHDVFLSAWQNLETYRPQGFPFSSWLYNIARNRVIDHYRTQRPHSVLENIDEGLLKVTGAAEDAVDQILDLEIIRRAMKQVTEEQQEVLMMRFVEDLSYPEIAAALSKSEGAVRLLQHRAINSLKEILNSDGGQNN